MDYARIHAVAAELSKHAPDYGSPVTVGPWTPATTELRSYPTTS